MKFYKCPNPNTVATLIGDTTDFDKHAPELVPNSTDAAGEKHVPVVTVTGNKVSVNVGSVNHPMLEEHYIGWVAIQTNKGFQLKNLKAGDKPQVDFLLTDGEKLEATYSYCNLHGLWKA